MSLHGIDLHAYATISADLAEGDRPMPDILRDRELSEAQWIEVTKHWSDRMASDAREAAEAGRLPTVTLDFSDAFANAQDAKKPLPPLDVRGWAKLRRDIDSIGMSRALGARSLGLADYMRLVRFWAKAIATNRALQAEFEEAQKDL